MARKYSNDIRTEITNLLADNTTGLISPSDVRQILNDIVDSFTPAAGAIRRVTSIPFNLTTVPKKLTIFDEVLATSPELIASAANDTIQAALTGFYNVNFTCSVAGSQNSDIQVDLRRNGLTTFWRALGTTTGASNRVELTLAGVVQATGVNDDFSLYVSVLSGSDNVDFFDTQLIMGTIQTNAP